MFRSKKKQIRKDHINGNSIEGKTQKHSSGRAKARRSIFTYVFDWSFGLSWVSLMCFGAHDDRDGSRGTRRAIERETQALSPCNMCCSWYSIPQFCFASRPLVCLAAIRRSELRKGFIGEQPAGGLVSLTDREKVTSTTAKKYKIMFLKCHKCDMKMLQY